MNIKGILFEEITDRLKNKVQTIQWIDRYKGQLEERPFPDFPKPAVFISLPSATYEEGALNRQKGTLTIRIRVVCDNPETTTDRPLDIDQVKAFYALSTEVFTALQGFSGTSFLSMKRLKEEEDEEFPEFMCMTMDFEALSADDNADRKKDYVLASASPYLVLNL